VTSIFPHEMLVTDLISDQKKKKNNNIRIDDYINLLEYRLVTWMGKHVTSYDNDDTRENRFSPLPQQVYNRHSRQKPIKITYSTDARYECAYTIHHSRGVAEKEETCVIKTHPSGVIT